MLMEGKVRYAATTPSRAPDLALFDEFLAVGGFGFEKLGVFAEVVPG